MFSPIAASWINEEFSTLDFGDTRRDERFKRLLTDMCIAPSVSIPVMSADWSETTAAYRFLHNEAIELSNVPECHIEQTLLRASLQPVLLAVQDTTQLDFSNHSQTKGLGPLHTQQQQGLLLHSTLAVSEDGATYGFLDQELWARPQGEFGKSQFRGQRELRDKESQKWLNGLMATRSFNAILPDTALVHVADREADIFDLLAMERPEKQHLLVRAHHNRALVNEEPKLWPFMEAQPVRGHMTVQVPGGHGKHARQATLALRYCPVELKAPHSSHGGLPSVTVTAVWVSEESRARADSIDWMLLSTWPVDNVEEAMRQVKWYTCRWRIEMFHRILKSGCHVEDCRLEDVDSLKRYIVMQSLVAWRVLYCMTTAREHPNWPCTTILDEEEWKVLYCYVLKKRTPPATPPTLDDAAKWIARMGGWLGRKGDGNPGMQSIQRGLERLAIVVEGYRLGQNTRL